MGGMSGVCGYTFYVAVDSAGTTISWTMADDYTQAVASHEHAHMRMHRPRRPLSRDPTPQLLRGSP